MAHEHHKNIPVIAAVITVSSSRTEKTDISGKVIVEAFRNAGMTAEEPVIVPDGRVQIRSAVEAALASPANCIVVNGGTGITRDDITIESVAPLFEKRMEGFGELFRAKSLAQIGTAVILTRADAGVVNGKAIFCIPGSPHAGKLAAEEIIVPEIEHILTHAGD
ncbi:MAG TPA: molybdenum cofactor biosynthesis protein MoaB [Methanocorpusculum sp.]|nr:molybdenum cofactor biosynthesis protein MoaB [Methanocorpusculum sp.]